MAASSPFAITFKPSVTGTSSHCCIARHLAKSALVFASNRVSVDALNATANSACSFVAEGGGAMAGAAGAALADAFSGGAGEVFVVTVSFSGPQAANESTSPSAATQLIVRQKNQFDRFLPNSPKIFPEFMGHDKRRTSACPRKNIAGIIRDAALDLLHELGCVMPEFFVSLQWTWGIRERSVSALLSQGAGRPRIANDL